MSQFDYTMLKDPERFEENRLAPHADLIAYTNAAEASSRSSLWSVPAAAEDPTLEAGRSIGEGSGFRLSLNGVWRFRYAENVAAAPKDFADPEVDCHFWDEIRVPGHLQMQGYGYPQYTNTQYPWDGHEDVAPGEIPTDFNPVGSYVKYFTLPEGFLKKGLFLSLEGSESGTAVWLNGHYVGYTEDSFTTHEFDLTPYVAEGENKLALQVFRFTAGSWCEDQDFFRFSGIFRSVSLFTKAETHIEDAKIITDLKDDFNAAQLNVTLKLSGSGTVKVKLTKERLDVDTLSMVQEPSETLGVLAVDRIAGSDSVDSASKIGAQECVELVHAFDVEAPALWSAEDPNLYLLTFEVYGEDGDLAEIVPVEIGFRKFELAEDHLLKLNGKRIVFNGVNRHEFGSRSGRAITEREMITDLLTMKRNNINALRMSHYPNNSLMYRLSDRLGIYVIDEANLETHGTWDTVDRGARDASYTVPKNHPEWAELILDRAKNMYERDKNHASVLIWSCGNESNGGKDIWEMSQYFRSVDTRPVHYESVCHDRSYPLTSDIESRMYASVREIRDYLAEHPDKPFISCEYTHAMGNSCGAMRKYTDLTREQMLYQGGFIWDYIDQTITTTDCFGKEYEAYGGDHGERPTDWDFSANGIAFGGDDRKPTPKMASVKYNYRRLLIDLHAREDKAEIENLYLFTDAAAFDAVLTVWRQGVKLEAKKLDLQLAPGEKKTVALGLGDLEDRFGDGELVVRLQFVTKDDSVYEKRGAEVAFGEEIVGVFRPETVMDANGTTANASSFRIVNGAHNWGVRGDGFEVLFSYNTGAMISYKVAGRELLESAVKPNFWRPPTQNDIGNGMPGRLSQWKIASLYATTKFDLKTQYDHYMPNFEPDVTQTEHSFRITFRYQMPTTPKTECYLTHEVFEDGTVKTTLSYDPTAELPSMPEFGVMLRMKSEFDRISWYGYGTEETYADRMEGARLGLFHGKVANQMAAYTMPQESGNHACTRYASVTDGAGHGLIFACGDEILDGVPQKNGEADYAYVGAAEVRSEGMSFSALPWTPSEIEDAQHPYDLAPAHHTILRVSRGQMGIAGDDTWGALTHPEYCLDTTKKMEFSFYMKGI